MRVGHGARRLPVLPGEPMGGYADRSQGVRGELDPLEVHVVTFADGVRRFALVVVDLICVNTDVVARIGNALHHLGIDDCWVAATHTHASPEAGCVPGGSPTPPEVATRLVDAAVVASRAAVAAEREAALHHTREWVTGFAGRRNAADVPMDIPVDALVISGGGTVTGVITVSPVHPTVLPADNSDVSADLNGGIRRALAAPGRWVVAATGAGGDISTRHTRRGRSTAEVERLATVMVGELVLTPHGRSTPEAIGRPVSRPVRLTAALPSEVDLTAGAPADARGRQVLEQGRRIARDRAGRGLVDTYDVEIQAIAIAGVVLVAIPAELFLDLGESIRAAAGSDVVVLGYTNGYLGYLPTIGTPPTYETLVSPVRPGSGEQVVNAAVAAVRSARDRV